MGLSGLTYIHKHVLVLFSVFFCVGCVTSKISEEENDDPPENDSEQIVTVRWAWIHGQESRSAPPFLQVTSLGTTTSSSGFGSPALTIELDLLADLPPTLALILVHCDRNWNPTRSIFIQDRSRLRATDFIVDPAPFTARNYDYSARITFPSSSNSVEIQRSGNYIARVVDYFYEDRVIAELRFFAVESTAGVGLQMESDFFESAWTEKAQEGLRAHVEVTPGLELFSPNFKAVHLIEQGKWDKPLVADEGSARKVPRKGDYRATWSPWYGSKILAEFHNIPSGNEHRLLDLTDLVEFPAFDGPVSTRLNDEPRFTSFKERDNNGLPRFEYVQSTEDDYVYFEFTLDIEGEKVYDDMAVVGTFNNWTPMWDWRLVFDPDSRRYLARGWLKRAVHEYEYVSGKWNVDEGILESPESTLIEGNSVYASQVWYALAYYRDQTSLSYDRIVGVGVDVSGGR